MFLLIQVLLYIYTKFIKFILNIRSVEIMKIVNVLLFLKTIDF